MGEPSYLATLTQNLAEAVYEQGRYEGRSISPNKPRCWQHPASLSMPRRGGSSEPSYSPARRAPRRPQFAEQSLAIPVIQPVPVMHEGRRGQSATATAPKWAVCITCHTEPVIEP